MGALYLMVTGKLGFCIPLLCIRTSSVPKEKLYEKLIKLLLATVSKASNHRSQFQSSLSL